MTKRAEIVHLHRTKTAGKCTRNKGKCKGFPYSLSSVGRGADHGVQAVSPHPPGGRLSLLSAMLVVTFPAAEHHRPLAGTKL